MALAHELAYIVVRVCACVLVYVTPPTCVLTWSAVPLDVVVDEAVK